MRKKKKVTKGWEKYVTQKDKIQYYSIPLLLGGALGYCFYNHWMGIVVLAGLLGFRSFKMRAELFQLKCVEAEIQFKEALYLINSSLATGQSLENAVKRCSSELEQLYGNQMLLVDEFIRLKKNVENGLAIEEALQLFASRLDIDSIKQFVDIVLTAKRSGGNLIEIVKYSTFLISEKIDLSQELSMIISKKRYEMLMMNLFVPGIIIYLKTTMTGFLDPLYMTLMGRIAMSILLVMYFLAMVLSNKIMPKAIVS